MIEVLLVEDQAMLRESLACAINAQVDMRVAASLADAAKAPALAAELGCGLVLMDVCTENGSNGIVAARRIKEADPRVRVVIMTGMPAGATAAIFAARYGKINPPCLASIHGAGWDFCRSCRPFRGGGGCIAGGGAFRRALRLRDRVHNGRFQQYFRGLPPDVQRSAG